MTFTQLSSQSVYTRTRRRRRGPSGLRAAARHPLRERQVPSGGGRATRPTARGPAARVGAGARHGAALGARGGGRLPASLPQLPGGVPQRQHLRLPSGHVPRLQRDGLHGVRARAQRPVCTSPAVSSVETQTHVQYTETEHGTYRVIFYDPALGTGAKAAKAYAGSLHFPNGMTLTHDGKALLICETIKARVTKYADIRSLRTYFTIVRLLELGGVHGAVLPGCV